MENEEKEIKALDIATNEEIKNMIYTIRGKQEMLDSDVARLYNYETNVFDKLKVDQKITIL